jgi:lysophospholipase L1-like esterase
MPLGDSITRGVTGSPNETGYRRFLYLSMTGSDYKIDFVGSQTAGTALDFDREHEGHSGYQADGDPLNSIAPNIFNWLVANPADVVLLHIGTNDISNNEDAASTANQIGQILDNIDTWEAANNDVSVVLARIINRNDGYSGETTALNNQIQAMADARIAGGDKIVVVDMETALTYPGDLSDAVHPNDGGYANMADAWMTDLAGFLPSCPLLPLAITSTPFTTGFTGFPYVYDVTAAGNPATQFSLLQGPLDMTIDAPTGVITWTPVAAGEFPITVEAVNGTETDQQLFDVVVSNAPVCPDGIINYWRLDEPGGSTYLDFPGGAYGFCSDGDCPTSIAGKTNNAQEFNGINQKIVSDAGGTSPRNEVTMMAWVRPYTLTPDVQGILVKDNSLRLELENNGECIDFTIWVNNGTKLELQPTGCAPPVGEWTHMAATYDGSTMTVYQNGDFIDSMSASGLIDTNANPYSIGYSEFEGQQRWFEGAIDDVVVFDRALDQGEIQQYIGMAPAGYCTLSGCAGDGDADGDVDGNDLAALAAKFAAGSAGSGEIAAFAGQLGKDDCQLTPY